MSLTRWKLIIEYDGSCFNGWQRQAGLPTIQQAVEEAIYGFCQQRVSLYVAGRTDSGVHAYGQVAHFDLDYGERPLTGFNLGKALNAHLRDVPISILQAKKVSVDFHARFNAVNKQYCYKILNRACGPALDRGRVWYVKHTLDTDAMREAAVYLTGHHDFTTFRDSECQAKSPVRTLDKVDITEKDYDICGGKLISFFFESRSFLHHQVRNMVGTLVLVGEGKWKSDDVKSALEARDRAKGGITAPAQGLYLMRVDYPL